MVIELVNKLKKEYKVSSYDDGGVGPTISDEMEGAWRRRILKALKEMNSPVISREECGNIQIQLDIQTGEQDSDDGLLSEAILAKFLAHYFIKSGYQTYLDISCYSENIILYHPEKNTLSIADYYRGESWDEYQRFGSLPQIFSRSFGEMLFEEYRDNQVVAKNKNNGYFSLKVGKWISRARKTIKGTCLTGGDDLDLYVLRSNLPNFNWIPGSLEKLDTISSNSKYDLIINLVQPTSAQFYAGMPLQKKSDFAVTDIFPFASSCLSEQGTFVTLLHESNIVDKHCIDYIREKVKLSPIALLPIDDKVYLALWKRNNGLTYSIDHYLFHDNDSSNISSGDEEIDRLIKKMKAEMHTNQQRDREQNNQKESEPKDKELPIDQQPQPNNTDGKNNPVQEPQSDEEGIRKKYDKKIIDDLCSGSSERDGERWISIEEMPLHSQRQAREIYERCAPKEFQRKKFGDIVQSIELGNSCEDTESIFIPVTETMCKKYGIWDHDQYINMITSGECVNPWDYDVEKCRLNYEWFFGATNYEDPIRFEELIEEIPENKECVSLGYWGNDEYYHLQDSIIHVSINNAVANPEYIKGYLGNKLGKIFLHLVRTKDIKGYVRIHNLMEAQIWLPSLELQNQHVAKQKAIQQLKEYADDFQSIEQALNRLMDAFSNEIGEMERGEFEKICCEIRGFYPNLRGYFDGDGDVAIRSIVSGLWSAKRNAVDDVDCSGVILLVVKGLEVLLNNCFKKHLCSLLPQSPDIEIIRRRLSDAKRNEKDHNTMRWLLQLTRDDIPSSIPINIELGNMAYVCRNLYECQYTMGGAIVSSIRGLGSENSRLAFKMIRAVRDMFPNQGVVNRLRNGYVHEHLATGENMEKAIEKVKACLQKLNESIT